MNRSLRSAGFQPAVSPTSSRPRVGLRERVQVAAPVGYARRLGVENPRYSRLESLRYRFHGPKAHPIWDSRLSMNHAIGTPDLFGSFRHGSGGGRMTAAFRARVGPTRCWPGVLTAALLFALVALTGCESTDGGGGSVSGSVYYGVGFYDPWYYGGYYDDPDIIVTPPPGERPPSGARPEQPIAKPPTVSAPRPMPMPSIPSRPMPRAR